MAGEKLTSREIPEPAMNTELVERLRDYAGDDHERPCQGRNYDCTCGYDERRDPLISAAADELTALTAKVALLTEALKQGLNLVSDGSGWGTVWRMEGHELYEDAQLFADAARRALSEPDKEGTVAVPIKEET